MFACTLISLSFADCRGVSQKVSLPLKRCIKGSACFPQQTWLKCKCRSCLVYPPMPSAGLPLPFSLLKDFNGHYLFFCCCHLSHGLLVSFFSFQNLQQRVHMQAALLPSQAQPCFLAPYPASPPHQAFCVHPQLPLPSLIPLTLLAQVQQL